jgi:hypothetical protein
MNKKYEAQALAISMVVLVVCSIVGISIYSRVSKDRSLTIEEQASSEALEIADILLDYLVQVPIEDVVTKYEDLNLQEDETLKESEGRISSYLQSLNVGGFNALDLGLCTVDGKNGNEYFLKVEVADENTFFEIRPGQVKSFVVKDLQFSGTCNINVTFSIRGEEKTGFSISKIYSNASGEVKEYEITDTENYCFGSGGICNNSENFSGTGWIPHTVDASITINLTDTTTYNGTEYTLDEIRIKAIGGTVALAQSSLDACTDTAGNPIDGLDMIQITAGANCSGVYRGKQILIPETKWSSTIFDYVIFNGQGAL